MCAAEDHHWWYVGLHDLVIRWVQAEVIRQGRPISILDAGCGTGRLCQLMQPFGEVAGCDIHPLALEATSRRGIKRVIRCDLVADAPEFAQYDVITSIDVLYHRMITDEAACLRNLHHSLKKGGLLLVQAAAFEMLRGAHDTTVHTRRRYRWREIVELLAAAGFWVEFASYRLLPLFLPVMAWRRVARPDPGGDSATSDLNRTWSSLTNRFLASYVKAENRLLTAGVSLPFGTSVFAVARK